MAYLQGRSRIRRYGFSLVLTLVVFTSGFLLREHFLQFIKPQAAAFSLFVMIVTISGWYGGLGPGLFSSLLVSVLNFFTFLALDPVPRVDDLAVTALFLFEGLIISIISEARYEIEFQKDKFIALAAHELKNPLTSIVSFSSFLRRDKRLSKKTCSEYLEKIEVQSAKMLEIINDLLDVTRIEIGKFDYHLELYDFDNLVDEVVVQQKMANPKRKINLSGASRKTVSGDRYRIGQVITNLLTNAIKYSPSEFPIDVRVNSVAGGVRLSVKDQGIGVSKGDLKNIFKEFYRSKKLEGDKSQGLGLGLFLSAEIVRRHKGKIWAKSNGKRGSTFFLQLPLRY